MSPLTVKILGSGNAAKKHALAFEALPELYQITGEDTADIVSICTPNSQHLLQCHKAMAEGQHAIVEKPVCGSLANIDSLIGVHRFAPSRVMPIFQYRFSEHDEVGFDFCTNWRRDESYWYGWRGKWVTALGGALTSHGIHGIDLLIQKNGMPFAVQVIAILPLEPEREISASLFWKEKGGLVSVKIGPNIEQGGFNLGDSHTGYVNQFALMHEALTTGNAMPVTLLEARQSLEVLTACYYSAYSRTQVTLPIEPSHPFYRGWSQAFSKRAERKQQRSQSFQKTPG